MQCRKNDGGYPQLIQHAELNTKYLTTINLKLHQNTLISALNSELYNSKLTKPFLN